MWKYTGKSRPPFAVVPGPGQVSVWDFPRPPAIVADMRRVVVRHGQSIVADSVRSVRVLETASAPTFYLPLDDVELDCIVPAPGGSFCEWKGRAAYWSVRAPVMPMAESVAWSYPEAAAAFAAIAGWISFYPGRLRCEVDGEVVRAQPGGFYGGWVTDEIVGPIKGEPGSGHW